jgi:hypothetical protein
MQSCLPRVTMLGTQTRKVKSTVFTYDFIKNCYYIYIYILKFNMNNALNGNHFVNIEKHWQCLVVLKFFNVWFIRKRMDCPIFTALNV